MSTPLRILVAEDNPGDVELVREALREHHLDCELFVAPDGGEVERYLERMGKDDDAPCPDLVLLDLNLPKATGYELFEMFRSHKLCSGTPVIVMTSSSAPRDRARATELGAARFFCKPCELTEFLELGSVVRGLAEERGLAIA